MKILVYILTDKYNIGKTTNNSDIIIQTPVPLDREIPLLIFNIIKICLRLILRFKRNKMFKVYISNNVI